MKKYFYLVLILILAIWLRLYNISVNPPSLYWDEASLGYNAYSILKTGRDEFGEFLPVSRFIAFGDYKPPGYIYASVIPVALFGLSAVSVRLPSVLAGAVMVLVTYFLTFKIFRNGKISLLAAFFLSLSPWSLHLSRAAFEANLAALFNLCAVYFFILSKDYKNRIFISFLFFVASFYTFNGNRIIAPLFIFALSVYYLRYILGNLKWYLISCLTALLLIYPSIGFLRSREGKLRFQEVSIFNNLAPVEKANQRISADGNTLLSRIIHNRRILFATDYLVHFSHNFSGRFLFTHGDVNPRLSVQGMGQLYVWEMPFLLVSILSLLVYKNKKLLFPAIWVLIATIPAAAARETPHALRTVSVLPVYQLFIAFGVYSAFNYLKVRLKPLFKQMVLLIAVLLFAVNNLYYLHIYHIHFPQNYSGEWQFGYRQMVEFVLDRQDYYDRIFVTSSLGRPYIYFAFYKPFEPEEFLNSKQATRDWFGFWQVNALGKIDFDLKNLAGYQRSALLVTSEDHLPPDFRLLKIVKNLKGEAVYLIGDRI